MKILVYTNRKAPDIFYLINTPKRRSAAYLRLFRILDKDWQVYDGLEEEYRKPDPDDYAKNESIRYQDAVRDWEFWERRRKLHLDLYTKAKSGDRLAAIELMNRRNGYEYEQIQEEEVVDPLP